MNSPSSSHSLNHEITSDFAEDLVLKRFEYLFDNPTLPVQQPADTTSVITVQQPVADTTFVTAFEQPADTISVATVREAARIPKFTINTLLSPGIVMLIVEYYIASGYFNPDGPQCPSCYAGYLDNYECPDSCENQLRSSSSPQLRELQNRYIKTRVTVSEDHTTNPVVLTHVCGSWRRLAVGMSSLWSAVSVVDARPCTHLMVETWLSRSKPHVPLTVRCVSPKTKYCGKRREAWEKATRVLMDHRHRIELLWVEVNDPHTCPWKYFLDPDNVYIRLQILMVKQGQGRRATVYDARDTTFKYLPSTISRVTPVLEELRVVDLHNPVSFFHDVPNPTVIQAGLSRNLFPSGSMKHLHLGEVFHHHLVDISGAFPNLETLYIQCLHHAPNGETYPSPVFPKLDILDIGSCCEDIWASLDKLVTPKLLHFRLDAASALISTTDPDLRSSVGKLALYIFRCKRIKSCAMVDFSKPKFTFASHAFLRRLEAVGVRVVSSSSKDLDASLHVVFRE